jgi:hypothetical protein
MIIEQETIPQTLVQFPKFPSKEIATKFIEEQIKQMQDIMGAPPEAFGVHLNKTDELKHCKSR